MGIGAPREPADTRVAQRTRPLRALAIAAVLGALIWAITPLVSEVLEAWDAQGVYLPALLMSGLAGGWLAPRPLWAHYLGSYAGQLAYVAFVLGTDGMFLAGALLLFVYCLIALAGAWLGGILRRQLSAPARA
ncbi:MAG: hypothetical protein Q4F49_06740 [Pseudoxanthomonas suwonensis]|nr:hypothetical protein [Pseudoxanthomonas suwonensis]